MIFPAPPTTQVRGRRERERRNRLRVFSVLRVVFFPPSLYPFWIGAFFVFCFCACVVAP